MLKKMRRQKQRLTVAGEKAGLQSIVNHSIEDECGTHAGFLFETEKQARAFRGNLAQAKVSSFLPMDTGRHVYTRWEPIMREQGAHHPALDPFKIPANRKAKIRYSPDMCASSLDILSRAVLVPTHPDHKADEVRHMLATIRAAA